MRLVTIWRLENKGNAMTGILWQGNQIEGRWRGVFAS